MILNKVKNLPQGVKASIAFFVSSLIMKGINFLTMPFYTRLLSTDEFGQISVYYTWVQLFGVLAMFCLSYGVFDCGMSDYPDRRSEFSFSLLILSNIITICFAVLFFLLYPHIKHILKIEFPFVILMCSVFIFQPAYSFWATRQRYELKYKWTVFWACFLALVSPVTAILAIRYGTWNRVYERILGAEIPALLIYIGFYFFQAKRARLKIDIRFWKSALAFNLPLLPHYLSAYLLNSSDKLMIAYYVGDSATAFYSVAYSVASIALIIWSAINSSLVPFTFDNLKRGRYARIGEITTPLVLVFALGCIFVIALAPEVVLVLGSEHYMEAIYAIPPIVGGTFFQVLYFLFSNVLYYYKKPKFVMLGSLAAMLLNLVLNYLFIPRYGYLAAGYTTLVSFCCQALIDYASMRKVAGTDIYYSKTILIISLAVIVVSVVSSMIYNCAAIRFGLMIIIMIVLACNSKRIKKLFLTMKRKEA